LFDSYFEILLHPLKNKFGIESTFMLLVNWCSIECKKFIFCILIWYYLISSI